MADRPLQIRLLGSVTLRGGDGDARPVAGVHPAALVTILALHAGRSYGRDELTALLWPDEAPDAARQRFRQALYALRQQIAQVCGSDAEILYATRTTVRLAPERIETDVARFEAALVAANEISILDARLALLERAVGLYNGELAPGIHIEPIQAERNRLSEVHLKALHLLAQVYEQAGQIEKAIEIAHRTLAANPLLEETYCDLMRLYSASGQPSAVVRQYQELERVLETELGERPSEATRTLMESLRRGGIDRIAERPHNGAQAPPPPPPELRNAILELSAAPPIKVGPVLPVFVAPVPAPRRRLWPLVLALAALSLTLVSLPALRRRLERSAPHASRSAVPAPRTLWERRFPMQRGDGDSEPTAISLDNTSTGIYVVGFVQTATHDNDFWTARYDTSGNLLWQRRYNGPGNDVDRARSVAISDPADVFVTGESDNGRGNGKTRLSGLDIATIRYNVAGKQIWVARYNGPRDGEDRPCRVVATGQGGCAVAGYSWDGVNADGSPRFAAILIDYNERGRPVWARRVLNSEDRDCRFYDLARISGGLLAAGCAYRRTEVGFETEVFLARYDMSGRQQWRHQVSACPGKDGYGCRLCADAEGNSYVVARAHNFVQSDHGVGTDCLIAKYDPDGNLKWARSYDGPAHLDDRARGVAVDGAGRVTVIGESLSAPNDLDMVTIQYDSDGTQRWVRRFAGAGGSADSPSDVIVCNDCVLVTGFTTSQRPVGSDLQQRDYVTLKYDANGALVWQAIYNGPAHGQDFGVCITADGQGNAFVTGQSAAVQSSDPHSTILTLKYAP
jgi:DNA-binding SARP family transcriptional activator